LAKLLLQAKEPERQSHKTMASHQKVEKMLVSGKKKLLEHKASNVLAEDQVKHEVEKIPAEVKTKHPEHKVSDQLLQVKDEVETIPAAVKTKNPEHKVSDAPAKDQLESEVEDMILAVNTKPFENEVQGGLGNTFHTFLQQACTRARSHPAATKYGLMFVVALLVLRILAFHGGYSSLALRCRREKDRSHKQPAASTLKVPTLQVGSQSKLGSTRNGNAGGSHMCPDLLVPEGSECTLMVPQLDVTGGSCVCISDAKGRPVLRATLGLSPVLRGCRASRLADIQRLVLSSATGDATFAYCRNGESQIGCGRTGLVMHNTSEAPFGVLKPDSCEVGSGYSLIANAGWLIYFRIDKETGHVSAIDECGKLVAVAQPTTNSAHAVHIGSEVDAGMIVLAILGIGVLDGRAAMSRNFCR